MNTKNISSVKSRFLEVGIIAMALTAMSIPLITNAALTRDLEQGMSGSDVSELQIFLAKDSTIYPQGLVTGFFGPLTKTAVTNFQARNGIATVGRVGPITRVAINAQMSGGVVGGPDVYAPFISGVTIGAGRNSATVSWNTNELAKGVVYYSTSPLTTYENLHTVDVSGSTAMTDSSYRTSQSVLVQGLQANTTYYYLVYSTDQGGNVSVMWSTFQTTN